MALHTLQLLDLDPCSARAGLELPKSQQGSAGFFTYRNNSSETRCDDKDMAAAAASPGNLGNVLGLGQGQADVKREAGEQQDATERSMGDQSPLIKGREDSGWLSVSHANDTVSYNNGAEGQAASRDFLGGEVRDDEEVAEALSAMEEVREWGRRRLCDVDPEIHGLIQQETRRQAAVLELIASENFVSLAVLDALGSPLANKYSEGLPGSRYYGGNDCVDKIETLCRERALAAFRLDPSQWGVNVQPYSCTSANFAVFTGLLTKGDRIMGLALPSGGHLSHGFYTGAGKKVSGTSIYFETLPYSVNPKTGLIDYDRMEEKAMEFRPKLFICGGSAYPRDWDFARCRAVADKCGAVLMCDMAHISGLVAAQECNSPFEYADVVTSTTHKTLRGPRGGIVFYRKGPKRLPPTIEPPRPPHRQHGIGRSTSDDGGAEGGSVGGGVYDLEERINFAIFPSLQGGPHNNHTTALAVAFKQVASPAYRAHIIQVKRNAAALASALMKRGCRLVTSGTSNHLMLWDVRPLGLTGAFIERVCEKCGITLNKNSVYGDAHAPPGGVRIGTPAMTTRGCREADMERIADFLVRAARIAQRALKGMASSLPDSHCASPARHSLSISSSRGGGAFKTVVATATAGVKRPRGSLGGAAAAGSSLASLLEGLSEAVEVKELRADVERFALSFDLPGVEDPREFGVTFGQ